MQTSFFYMIRRKTRSAPAPLIAAVMLVLVIGTASLSHAAEEITTHTPPYSSFGQIERLDPAVNELVPADAQLERLATGFQWSEGPVWLPKRDVLLFTDVPADTMYRWQPGKPVSIFMQPSGGPTQEQSRGAGANGLMLSPAGDLLVCQHGTRQLGRLDQQFFDQPSARRIQPIAQGYQGTPFNSPNDVIVHATGDIYFTDPTYGMPEAPKHKLGFNGVYRLDHNTNEVHLLTKDLGQPNGIALAPSGKTLYVNVSGGKHRQRILAFTVQNDGSLSDRRVFFDGRKAAKQHPDRPGVIDGMAVDQHGNIFTSAPGGVWIINPKGKLLGWIVIGKNTANCCFGGPDGQTLYVTADDTLCRIKLNTTGLVFTPRQ